MKETAEEWSSLGANVTRQEALVIKKLAIDEYQARAKLKMENNKGKIGEKLK